MPSVMKGASIKIINGC